MKINYKITTGLLAVAFVYDTAANIVAQRRIKNLIEVADTTWTINRLLAQRLDEAGVELSDYDRIAINTLIEK